MMLSIRRKIGWEKSDTGKTAGNVISGSSSGGMPKMSKDAQSTKNGIVRIIVMAQIRTEMGRNEL